LSTGGLKDIVKGNGISQAIGCGVRVNTAIGPVRFDIGWKIGPRAYDASGDSLCDRSYAWFVTLGQAF